MSRGGLLGIDCIRSDILCLSWERLHTLAGTHFAVQEQPCPIASAGRGLGNWKPTVPETLIVEEELHYSQGCLVFL